MPRLPNRIKEKIDFERLWSEELKGDLKELYYESEKYDSILHSKVEILMNHIDDLISVKNTEPDFIDKRISESDDETIKNQKYNEFQNKKDIVRNLIEEIVGVINMESYNVEHIKNAPEEFKKQVKNILSPLDSFYESIGYVKRNFEEEKPPERIPNEDEANIRNKYEKEFKINKKE